MEKKDTLVLGGHEFTSRFILGSGKFSVDLIKAAVEQGAAQIVTMNLFPLQINPHFTNALPEGHKGETREQRIRELLVVAPELTIIGLPEGNWITVSKGHATLGGPNTTYVFKAGEEAVPLEAGHRF